MSAQEVTASQATKGGKAALFRMQIALDATPHSTLVVENLHHFSSSQQTACDFLYVIPNVNFEDRKFLAFDEEAQQETVRVVNEQFDQYAKTLAEHQLILENRHFLKDEQSVEDGIIHFAEKNKPDLLVLGMHEEQPKRKGWRISSMGYSIATHAPCSTLVIKNPVLKGARLKVLFATDGSVHAEKAAQDMIRFLPKENTEIIIFSVVSVNYYVLPVVEPYVDYAPLERAMKGDATELLERTRKAFEAAGFTVSNAFFNLGDPVEQILEESDKNDIDLIALGSHGAGGRLTSWLLGSVSSKVLEYSSASVAILK